jgi:hypothetical protein
LSGLGKPPALLLLHLHIRKNMMGKKTDEKGIYR